MVRKDKRSVSVRSIDRKEKGNEIKRLRQPRQTDRQTDTHTHTLIYVQGWRVPVGLYCAWTEDKMILYNFERPPRLLFLIYRLCRKPSFWSSHSYLLLLFVFL